MKQIILVMMAFILTSPSFASESKGGGGGGGIYINGRYETLAQAGIRLAPESGGDTGEEIGWIMSAALLSEINRISQILPFGQYKMKTQTVGKYGTFLKVESVSDDLLGQVRSAYAAVLQEVGAGELRKYLEIFAISDSTKTFLLPAFFKLDTHQQALILFHEGIVRNRKQDYRLALKFDGYLLDYIKNRGMTNYSPLRFFQILTALTSDRSSNVAATIQYVESKLGRRVGMKDMAGTYERAVELQSQFPEYMSIFRDLKGDLNAREYMFEGLERVRVAEIQRACRGWSNERNGDVRVSEQVLDGMVFVNCDVFSKLMKSHPQNPQARLYCSGGNNSFCSYKWVKIESLNSGIRY